jgi:hypothetical protein
VNIRFTSTLTHEDENRIAAALLKAVAGFLDVVPIAYSIRIDTIDGSVFRSAGADTSIRPGIPGIRPASLPQIES